MKPHKHAALIKQWADDQSLVIEYKYYGEWKPASKPLWHEDWEYRIAPKKPVVRSSLSDKEIMSIESNFLGCGAVTHREIADAAAQRQYDEMIEIIRNVKIIDSYMQESLKECKSEILAALGEK